MTTVNLITWSALTSWDFYLWISYYVPFSRQISVGFIILSSIQSIIIRYFTEFVWKRIPPIDHCFTVVFLSSLNLILGVICGTITFIIGGGQELGRLQGLPSFLTPIPEVHPR